MRTTVILDETLLALARQLTGIKEKIKNRAEILQFLRKLPSADAATDEEVLRVIENKRLWGQGIGWIGAHLLASALLTSCALWTLDAALRK